ncbi:MAG: hypothetical protein NTY19_16345 [Planctomycetota bacterium]|nr:hypothetical protein [Planctomycetota bacterium]
MVRPSAGDDFPEQAIDPLIEDVRKVRRELSRRFGNDVAKLCDYLQQVEAEHALRVVAPDREPAVK